MEQRFVFGPKRGIAADGVVERRQLIQRGEDRAHEGGVVHHDILVGLHSSDSGVDRYTNEWLGAGTEMRPFEGNAFRALHSFRPVEDATASLVCSGTLSRFPTLPLSQNPFRPAPSDSSREQNR